jgi:hypothetical protein
MLVCSSHSSVFVREKCWYVGQHFSLTNTELWLPHTNISPLQTQSYNYHISTLLRYKHRAMTTTYQHFSLANIELWLPHTNISPLQTQSYDYHIPTFLPYNHRAMTTTYQHFSLTNTEIWLPHTNISALQTQSYDYHVCKGEMLVCGSHSSVFVRQKCWYVVVISLCLQGRNVGMW